MMLLRFIHRALKARFLKQRVEIRKLLAVLRSTDIALDIGANKGSYLFWLSRAVKKGKVVAFEPQAKLAEQLVRLCQMARLRNVVVEAAGVSDKSGLLALHIPGQTESPGASFEQAVKERAAGRQVMTRVVSLDDYFTGETRHIGAIKIDVEGHELAVFKGAQRLLQTHRPLLVFESEARHLTGITVRDILNHLSELGYDGSFVRGSELIPIAEFDPSLHQKSTGDRFWAAPGYCNNFILSAGRVEEGAVSAR